MLALFVIVGIVFVLVKRELSICATVDADFERISGFLGGVLDIRAERDDRSCPNEKRKTVERSGSVNCASALRARAGPEVVPGSIGKVDTARSGARFGDGADQNCRTEEKFVGYVLRADV